MAIKVCGCTVIDDSRNVCANAVCACCIDASTTVTIPSGTTACRPSGSAGQVFFDTDEGALIAHDGTEWATLGGSTEPKFSSGDDGTVAATSYKLGKTATLCMQCISINDDIYRQYSIRTPVDRAFCAPGSKRGGHLSFGADGSFVMTTGIYKNVPAQTVTAADDKCFRHASRQHGVFQNNRCCYKLSDAVAVSGYVACCYQANSKANWCLAEVCNQQCFNMCNTHRYYRFYALFGSAGVSENGGYLTGGCCPGNADYIVPYTSLGSSLCPAYKVVKCACPLIKSVFCNYVLTNYSSCGGRWLSGAINNLLCYSSNDCCKFPYGVTITCQKCSTDLFLQDVTDLGYWVKSGSCYTTTSAGTCGCFRHLNTRNACDSCYYSAVKQQAWENPCSGQIFVSSISNGQCPKVRFSTSCCSYGCLVPKLLKISRETGCMISYRPFGSGCGGGFGLPHAECMYCHPFFASNLNSNGCRTNSIFYSAVNSDCIRIITSHNISKCQGTCRYFEQSFSLWNVSNDSCIYAICAGQLRTCVAGYDCCHAIPMHVNLLAWDESTCKGFWSMTFGDSSNDTCRWSRCGIGFAITQTDFTNCTLCILDGTRSCNDGCSFGQWGKGSMAACQECIVCCIQDLGDGIWPMKNGNIAVKWNFCINKGNCNCCSGAFIRKEDWTSPSFNICCIFPSAKTCCACFATCFGVNCCVYTDVLCKMPKYCCITAAQDCLLDTSGGCMFYCLFPNSNTLEDDHYCLCETTYGEAVCWLDRPSSTCCVCGCVNFSGSSSF